MKKMLKLSVLLTVLLLSIQQGFSQSTSWKGTVNTYWNNAGNWTNGIPTNTKNAILGDAAFTGTYQPKVNAAGNCLSITIGGARATTLSCVQTLNVYSNLIINSNGKLLHSAGTIYLMGNWTNNGIYSSATTSPRVITNGTAQTIGGTAVSIFRRLTINLGSIISLASNIKVDSAGSALAVYGVIDPGQSPTYTITSTVSTKVYSLGQINVNAATFAANYILSGTTTLYTGCIVNYSSTAVDQIVSSAYTYSTLMISGTGTKSLAANLPNLYGTNALYGKIFITGGTFDIKTFTANRASTRVGGELNISNGATLKIGGLNNFPLNYSTRTFGVSSTVDYSGVDQTVSTQAYGNLTVSTAGIKTAAVALTILGNLTILNGSFNTNAVVLTHNIAGNFIMTGGIITGTNATYNLNGTTDQTASLSGSILKLNINKTTGKVNLGNDLTVTNTLNFVLGNIVTGTYNVIIPASSTITNAGQTTGWVNGNLQKPVPVGSGLYRFFEVGDVNYSPVSIFFSSVAMAGTLTANTKSNDQPEVDYSGIDPAKSVNRFWSLNNAGILFTNATATFNWIAADIDAGSTTANFKAGLFNGTSWSLPAIASPSATSIQASALTSLGDFAVGERITKTTWTGAALTSDWFTPKNWRGLLPSATYPTFITDGIAAGRVYPILTSGTGIVNDLTVENASSLTINAGTLQVAGVLSSTGTITAAAGTVEFNGSSLQTIAPATFANNTIKNLIISNDVALGGAGIVTGTVNIANGKTFATNDNLVLKSDATGTAAIGSLPVNGSGVATAFITGKVSVERYIPARKAWRLLSTPIKTAGTTTITDSWQEGAYISSFGPNPNPHPGYGVHICGGTAANGFDESLTNLPTVKVYNGTSNSFVGIPATPGTFIPLNTYSGYLVYIRGDRGIDLSQGANAAVTPTTLRMKGDINTGNQSSTVNAVNFTVLGNPYPSPIDFGSITKNNMKNSFYVWDPKLAGSNGLGAYVTVSWNSGTSSYDVTTSASPVSQYIPSGEAILIESQDGINPGSVTIKESDKTSNGSDFQFGRTGVFGQKLRLNLYEQNSNGTSSLLDGSLVTYDDANANGLDRDDIKKIGGDNENIGLMREGTLLSIERRRTIRENDTAFINIGRMRVRTYKLSIISQMLDRTGFTAVIKDKFSADINNRPLNTNGTTDIIFTVTTDPASYAADRFSVVFSRNGGTIPGTTLTAAARNAKTTLQATDKINSSIEKGLVIYPNPVQNNATSLQLANLEKGNYVISIVNLNGQLIKKLSLQHNGGELKYNIPLESNLPAGKYQVQLTGNNVNIISSMIKE